MDFQALKTSLAWIGPEIALVATILLVILADIVRLRALTCALTILGFVVAGAFVQDQLSGGSAGMPGAVFANAYAVDGFSAAFKLTFLGAGILTAFFSGPAIAGWASGRGEYYALLASCVF